MKWLSDAYNYVWYHVQSLWIKSWTLRRPFTFMMRDFWAQHKFWGMAIFLAVSTAITYLLARAVLYTEWISFGFGVVICFFHGCLFAHLWWGTPYKKGEQEYPTYVHE